MTNFKSQFSCLILTVLMGFAAACSDTHTKNTAASLDHADIAPIPVSNDNRPPQPYQNIYITDTEFQAFHPHIAQLIPRLRKADIIILGETHDNGLHHRLQAELINFIAPSAVAFEMVPESKEQALNAAKSQGLNAMKSALDWDSSGWPDWALYAPVFKAASDAYLAGGGVTSNAIKTAMQAGAQSAFDDSERYGLDAPLPELLHAELVQELITSHCNAIPATVARQMVEAQRLRDASFAKAVIRAKDTSGGQVVLITGSGHARKDRGVPRYLSVYDPNLKIISLSFFETPQAEDPNYMQHDLAFKTPTINRADPCAEFTISGE